MAYAEGRTYYDADSHLVETPGYYDSYIHPKVLHRAPPILYGGRFPLDGYHEAVKLRAEPGFAEAAEAKLMERKLWSALGSYDAADRARALNGLGFGAQLVFDSFMRSVLKDVEQGDDLDVLYGLAAAHHNAMVDFCSGDGRLLPVSYVPMGDIDRTLAFAEQLLARGAVALEIPGECPKRLSPSHVGFDPLWEMAAAAKAPIMFHLGSSRLSTPRFHENGRPKEKFFAGGDVPRMGTIEYIASPAAVIEILTTLVADGVLQRNPDLRIGVIEEGASWMPGYLHFLDSAQTAFSRNEKRLQALDRPLSEYIRDHVRIAPFCHEDVGWMIEQGCAQMVLFSSDYPHIEGGRNPLGRFEANLDAHGIDAAARDRFYEDNFVDLFGGRVPEVCQSPRKHVDV